MLTSNAGPACYWCFNTALSSRNAIKNSKTPNSSKKIVWFLKQTGENEKKKLRILGEKMSEIKHRCNHNNAQDGKMNFKASTGARPPSHPHQRGWTSMTEWRETGDTSQRFPSTVGGRTCKSKRLSILSKETADSKDRLLIETRHLAQQAGVGGRMRRDPSHTRREWKEGTATVDFK